MLDPRCWTLSVGCWMFDVGCSTARQGHFFQAKFAKKPSRLARGHRQKAVDPATRRVGPDAGSSMLDVERWMFDVGCSTARQGRFSQAKFAKKPSRLARGHRQKAVDPATRRVGPDAGSSMLDVERWMFDVGCSTARQGHFFQAKFAKKPSRLARGHRQKAVDPATRRVGPDAGSSMLDVER